MTAPPAYLLAGGKSSRFGSDKARATLGGVPLIARVADVFRIRCDDVAAVADRPDKYADLGLPTIADRRPGLGPLAGVETALRDRRQRHGDGWLLLASCDLVGLKAAWLDTVADALDSPLCRTASAVAFRGNFWQPFPAAFHTRLLPSVERLLDEGRASFQFLLSQTESNAVALPFPADWSPVAQVNTREELNHFEADRA